MEATFNIHRGINRPIEFKGIKAQYILYLVLCLLGLLMLFAVLYIIGLSVYVLLPVTITVATVSLSWITKFSRKYGVHGLAKNAGYRNVPKALRSTRLHIVQHDNP